MQMLHLLASLHFLLSLGLRLLARAQDLALEDTPCFTPLGDLGVCITLRYCPQVVNLFNHLPLNKATQYSMALQRICNFQKTHDNYPVVCCSRVVLPSKPDSAPTSTTLRSPTATQPTTSIEARSELCQDPNGEPGVCKSLINCAALHDRLRSASRNEELKVYFRLSHQKCGSVGTQVCCPTGTSNPTTLSSTVASPAANTTYHLPTEEEGCGFVRPFAHKIVDGSDSSIGAWPWMALVGYDVRGLTPFRCGGTLVTARHVITAAHCLRSDLSFVRLGEFDLSTEIETQHVDINVQKKVRHPDFGRDLRHDVAVLLLERTVQFTELISPICLPISRDLRSKSYVGSLSYVAGWGRTTEGGITSNVLQQLEIPVLDNARCRRSFELNNGTIFSDQQFDESVLCAGVTVGAKDTCQGDSGGPLMIPELYKGIVRYYLIGIVSYGIGCGRGIPGVYTSTQHFLDWIGDQISAN